MRIRHVFLRSPLWLAALATALVLVDLGRRILATNDEARFALLGQDMLARGSWFFPSLNGVVYHSKPLLQAWLIALCSWPAGRVTQLTAVLPSALAGIATILAVFAIGRSMFGAEAGRFAALVAMTTQGWFLHVRLPMPDMLLTLCLTTSLLMFWRMVEGRPGPNWLAFYALVGLGFWAKGAAGLMPLAAAVIHAIATRGLPWRQRNLHLPAGFIVVVVLIAPWWLGQWHADTDALREVVVADNLVWYVPTSITVALLSGPFQHLVGILFPWVLVVPAVLWQAVRFLRGRGSERDAVHVLVIWSAVLLGCVALSEQQRLRYYLPLVPTVALLIGWWCAGAVVKRRAVAEIPWSIYGVAAVLVGLATVVAIEFRPTWANPSQISFPTSLVEAAVMGGGLAIMIGALAYGMAREALGRAFLLAWLGSVLWVGGWYHWELERRNAAYDYPRVEAEARRLVPDAPVVAAWGVYELPFSFYLDRPVISVDSDGDLRRVMAEHPQASAVLTMAALAQLEERQRFRVLPLHRLNFDSIVLVTNAPDASRAGARP
jgi:4-amino-4-deoxy-L-arabinose transferase-like glycosyltransferase